MIYTLMFLLLLLDSLYVYGASEVRIILTLLLLVCAMYKGAKLNGRSVFCGILLIFSIIVGLINFPQTCIQESKIIIFLFLYAYILRFQWNRKTIINYLLICSYMVNLYLLIAMILFFVGVNIDYPFLPESDFVITGDTFGFSSSTLQSLSFFLVFNIIYAIKNKNVYGILPVVFGIVNVILSQRRAFFIFPSIIALYYLLKYSKSAKYLPYIVAISVIVTLGIGFLAAFFTDMSAIDYILYNFDLLGYDEDSDGMRFIQFNALWPMLLESPIWGQGIGAYSSFCIRDEDAPFSYELSLFALLVKFGLPIFCWLFGSYLIEIRKKIRINDDVIPITLGSLCLFISNMTNPYLNVSTVLFFILPFTNWKKEYNYE